MTSSLQRQLRAMRGKRVAVVGDVMLDEFLWGDATRISPEAPVPVVLLERQTSSLGGAANVAANVAGLGGCPILFSGVGVDAAGLRLRKMAEAAGVGTTGVTEMRDRPTTVKHRIFARNKHLLRFDAEVTSAWPLAATRSLVESLRKSAPSLDALVVSDYAKGCVTPALVRAVGAICQQFRIPWCVDPKTVLRYRGATVLKPNQHELQVLSGQPTNTLESIRVAAARVLRRQGCEHLLVTRGQHGMALFGADGSERILNSGGQAVSDVTGAGDTVLAALGLGLAAQLSVWQAATLANQAAAYVVSQPGTAVVRPENLIG